MKKTNVYYSVHVSKDRTICLAFESKKPRRKTYQRGPVIDEDGCHDWFPVDFDRGGLTQWARAVMNGAIVNKLNLKKVLRQQIEPRLEAVERKLGSLQESLDRIEAQLTKQ